MHGADRVEGKLRPSPWWIECSETVGIDQVLALAAPSARHLVQLAPGRLVLRLFRLEGPGLEVHGGHANLPLRAVGTTPPPGKVTVSLVLEAPGRCTMKGQDVRAGDALVWPAGLEYDGIAPVGHRWATAIVPDVFAGAIGGVAGSAGSRGLSELRVATLAPAMLDEVNALLGEVDAWRAPEIADLLPTRCRALRTRWYELLDAILRRASPVAPRDPRSVRALTVVRAVEDLWLAHLDRREHLQDAADAAGVSPRTVETAFQRVFGLPPLRYLEVLRAHALFRELRREDPGGPSSVGEAETRCGISHPSRFAARYRAIFGENPSDTFGAARRDEA